MSHTSSSRGAMFQSPTRATGSSRQARAATFRQPGDGAALRAIDLEDEEFETIQEDDDDGFGF